MIKCPYKQIKTHYKFLNFYFHPVLKIFNDKHKTIISNGDENHLNSSVELKNIFTRGITAATKPKKSITEVREQIKTMVTNSTGLKSATLDTNRTFESLVKNQITDMKLPVVAMIDRAASVYIQFLSEKLQESFESHQILADTVQDLITKRFESFRNVAVCNLEFVFDSEKSYINTDHPDFLKTSVLITAARKKSTKTFDEPLILHQGTLFKVKGISGKPMHFVLDTQKLTMYDPEEYEKKCSLELGSIQVFTFKSQKIGKKMNFEICDINNNNVYKDKKSLLLTAPSEEALEDWLLHFSCLGIIPQEKFAKQASTESLLIRDLKMEQSVETIRASVNSYMNIVRTTIQDSFSKIVMHSMINSITSYSKHDLLADLLTEFSFDLSQVINTKSETVQNKQRLLSLVEQTLQYLQDTRNMSGSSHSLVQI